MQKRRADYREQANAPVIRSDDNRMPKKKLEDYLWPPREKADIRTESGQRMITSSSSRPLPRARSPEGAGISVWCDKPPNWTPVITMEAGIRKEANPRLLSSRKECRLERSRRFYGHLEVGTRFKVQPNDDRLQEDRRPSSNHPLPGREVGSDGRKVNWRADCERRSFSEEKVAFERPAYERIARRKWRRLVTFLRIWPLVSRKGWPNGRVDQKAVILSLARLQIVSGLK